MQTALMGRSMNSFIDLCMSLDIYKTICHQKEVLLLMCDYSTCFGNEFPVGMGLRCGCVAVRWLVDSEYPITDSVTDTHSWNEHAQQFQKSTGSQPVWLGTLKIKQYLLAILLQVVWEIVSKLVIDT